MPLLSSTAHLPTLVKIGFVGVMDVQLGASPIINRKFTDPGKIRFVGVMAVQLGAFPVINRQFTDPGKNRV